MADFIHAREYLNEGDVVIVECSHQCNIILLDDSNFQNYRSGHSFKHFGGALHALSGAHFRPSYRLLEYDS
jgi:hypothetical protein